MVDKYRDELIRIKSEIDGMISSLSRLRFEIDAVVGRPDDALAELVDQKIESRTCLFCGKRIPQKATAVRGLHQKCYRYLRRQIEQGAASDASLVAAGQMAPPSKAGRKSEISLVEAVEQSKRSGVFKAHREATGKVIDEIDKPKRRAKGRKR